MTLTTPVPTPLDEMFDSLVSNAIDFLYRSVEETEEKPKYAVINLFAAIELFLKARLFREHWSLIFSKPETASLSKLLAGDFQSVGFEESVTRIKNVLEEEIGINEKNCFKQIREHRNKLVHYYVPKYIRKSDPTLIQTIVGEQCRGWYYLHGLLTGKWGVIFRKHLVHIENLNQRMHNHRVFLEAKFNTLLAEIESSKKKGSNFTECPSCGFVSAQISSVVGPVLSGTCLVCVYKYNFLIATCPSCSKETTLRGGGKVNCSECSSTVSIKDVLAPYINLDSFINKELHINSAYCGNCRMISESTVFSVEDKWVCVYCLDTNTSFGVGRCEWCQDYVTGSVGTQYAPGCVRCALHLMEEAEELQREWRDF